jgi:hypothetical protein
MRVIGFIVPTLCGFLFLFSASTSSPAQSQPKGTFRLTIALQNRHNPDFRVCMPISADAPIELAWVEGGVKNELSASLLEPEGGKYPIKFTHKQSRDESRDESTLYSSTVTPKLTLDKSEASIFVASSLFENYYSHALLLSRDSCNRKAAFEWKPDFAFNHYSN